MHLQNMINHYQTIDTPLYVKGPENEKVWYFTIISYLKYGHIIHN